jgi:uncharacterized integral membrane protein (TIGR00697 family)
MNELVFLAHCFLLAVGLLVAFALGSEALISFISVLGLLVNLFVVKQISLFGLTVTATDAFAVGTTLGLNLLQEYWGPETAKKAIWISFFCSFFVIFMSMIHLEYIPSMEDKSHEHFSAILQFVPRIVVASLVTYLIVMYTDSLLYAFFKRRFGDAHLVARNYVTVGITQLLDTVLFSILGLWGIVTSILNIIIVSYTIKVAVIFLTTPFMTLAHHTKKIRFKNKPAS